MNNETLKKQRATFLLWSNMGILPARPSGMPCSMYRNISSMMLPKSPRMLPSLRAFDVPFSQPENSGMCGNSESDSISIFSTEDSGRPRLRDLKMVNAYYFSIGFLGGQNPNMDQSIWPQVFWDVRILTWIYQMVVTSKESLLFHTDIPIRAPVSPKNHMGRNSDQCLVWEGWMSYPLQQNQRSVNSSFTDC